MNEAPKYDAGPVSILSRRLREAKAFPLFDKPLGHVRNDINFDISFNVLPKLAGSVVDILQNLNDHLS
jgi:hypothetical protein